VDASSQVTVTKSGLIYNRGTRLFYGTFTITNNSAQTIAAPIQVVLTNLTPGVTLANATGSFAGSSYITAVGSLAPGASLSVPVQFSNPSNSLINTTVKTYTGAF
jgi:hypothetical protein